MRRASVVALLLCACQGPKGDTGDPGAMGAMGLPGRDGTNGTTPTFDFSFPPGADLAGFDMAGYVPPQTVTCVPGKAFCVNSTQLATCTLSGADAILGADCAAQGSTTNAATCVTTGCPSGQTACCRRAKPIWHWNLTQPALTGQQYVADYTGAYLVDGKTCGSTGLVLAYAYLFRQLSSCPRNDVSLQLNFSDRSAAPVGTTVSLPNSGVYLSFSSGPTTCSAWTGTVRVDSDLPDWQVTLNATCSDTGKSAIQVVGTLGGSE